MYIKLLQVIPEYAFDQRRARCLGNRWDVSTAGSAAQHTALEMRRGTFHQERLKLVLGYGSAVRSLEVLPEEQRK